MNDRPSGSLREKIFRKGYWGKMTKTSVWYYLYSLCRGSQESHFPRYIVNYSN